MNTLPSLMVFSDLDGTLIDHHSYTWHGAEPALQRLREAGATLVLASSKTAPEIARIRKGLHWDDAPAIVENGAGLLPPFETSVPDAPDYDRIRTALDDLPADLRALFRGFGDMSVADVTQACGLPEDAARLAKDRAFSEPGIWSGSDAQQAEFLRHLHDAGVVGQRGGRFLTLSLGSTKADRMVELVAAHGPTHTIALGDAPNDRAMLETAEFGVVVANPNAQPLPALKGEDAGRILRTTLAGPQGWNDAILELLNRLCP